MSAAQSKNKSFGSFINPVFHENAKEDFFQENKRNRFHKVSNKLLLLYNILNCLLLRNSVLRETITSFPPSFEELDGGLEFANCPTCNGIGRVKK